MKILLDESLPRKLRNDFNEEHEVLTVRDMGWLGKKNGELSDSISNESSGVYASKLNPLTISHPASIIS